MKKTAVILSFILAGACVTAPVPNFMSDSLTVAYAADLEAKAEELAAKAEALDEKAAAIAAAKAQKAGDADDEEGNVAELTPVEVVTFKTAAGETVSVVTFSDGSLVAMINDGEPLVGAAALDALSSMGISLTVSEEGNISSVETVPSVEVVQAPISADAVTDESIVAAVAAATEAANIAFEGSTEDSTDGSSKAEDEDEDSDGSTAGEDEDATSTPESAPSLGINVAPGSSAADSLGAIDDPSSDIPDVYDASPTAK